MNPWWWPPPWWLLRWRVLKLHPPSRWLLPWWLSRCTWRWCIQRQRGWCPGWPVLPPLLMLLKWVPLPLWSLIPLMRLCWPETSAPASRCMTSSWLLVPWMLVARWWVALVGPVPLLLMWLERWRWPLLILPTAWLPPVL